MTHQKISASLVVVEDNERLRQEIVNSLQEYGLDVRGVDGGAALDISLRERRADLIILDLNMGEEDGISIAKRMRTTFPAMGILIHTARVRSIDKEEGYQSGADVYMTKPARPAEMVAAITNLLNRLAPQQVELGWVLNTKAMFVRFQHTTPIALTVAETELLSLLTSRKECVDIEAMQVFFKKEDLDSNKFKLSLEVLASRLRTKLSPHTGGVNPIKSVRNRGYLLTLAMALQ